MWHANRFKDHRLRVILTNMKSTLRSRSLTRSLMALFGTKEGVNPHTRYPDAYYKPIWFDKRMFDGIEWVARIERVSKKKAARLLIEEGFRKYIGNKLHEAIQVEIAVDELRRKPKLTRFVLGLRKLARDRGMDISQFI